MKLKGMKIATRLSLGFGVVLTLMVVLVVVGIFRLKNIGHANEQIVSEDWVKSTTAQAIDSMMRTNVQLSMELFLLNENEKDKATDIRQSMVANQKATDAALSTLGRLAILPEEKVLMSKILASRSTYSESTERTLGTLDAQNWQAAAITMTSETLPALAALQRHISNMVDLQKEIGRRHGVEASSNIDSALQIMIVTGIAALFVGGSFAYVITRSITQPLLKAVQVAKSVASGDLTSHIDVTGSDEAAQLLRSVKEMNDGLRSVVGQVRGCADTIAGTSMQISTGSIDLSSRTAKQASALERTVASMRELTRTVAQNAESTQQASQLSSSASAVAMKGGTVIKKVVNMMDTITESARQIADIISVIDGIAFQTNILALNASVEAARAGVHGRGFAVVATEVQNLAKRSATAAKEIKALIQDSVEKVDSGSELAAQAGVTMEGILISVQQVANIMSEISIANSAQSKGIDEVSQTVDQMDLVTQQNASLAEQATAATVALRDQTHSLVELMDIFRLGGEPR